MWRLYLMYPLLPPVLGDHSIGMGLQQWDELQEFVAKEFIVLAKVGDGFLHF